MEIDSSHPASENEALIDETKHAGEAPSKKATPKNSSRRKHDPGASSAESSGSKKPDGGESSNRERKGRSNKKNDQASSGNEENASSQQKAGESSTSNSTSNDTENDVGTDQEKPSNADFILRERKARQNLKDLAKALDKLYRKQEEIQAQEEQTGLRPKLLELDNEIDRIRTQMVRAFFESFFFFPLPSPSLPPRYSHFEMIVIILPIERNIKNKQTNKQTY